MKHDVAMVYRVQNKVLKKVLADFPETKEVTYFSHGCASQHKNQKIYLICVNIVLNSELMLNGFILQLPMEKNLVKEWEALLIKRLTRLASLGRATTDQISTATAMFNFCKDNIKGINFIYLSNDEVDVTRAKFAKRLDNIKTIRGTRLFMTLFQ